MLSACLAVLAPSHPHARAHSVIIPMDTQAGTIGKASSSGRGGAGFGGQEFAVCCHDSSPSCWWGSYGLSCLIVICFRSCTCSLRRITVVPPSLGLLAGCLSVVHSRLPLRASSIAQHNIGRLSQKTHAPLCPFLSILMFSPLLSSSSSVRLNTWPLVLEPSCLVPSIQSISTELQSHPHLVN